MEVKGEKVTPPVRRSCKLVLVGDTSAGKTTMVSTYVYDRFPDTEFPMVLEPYPHQWQASDDEVIDVHIWDTHGGDEPEISKPRIMWVYEGASVFLLVFALDNQKSFDRALNKWYPEIKGAGAQERSSSSQTTTPVILVGAQKDMRESEWGLSRMKREGTSPVSREAAEEAARQLNVPYIECSSFTRENLHAVFDTAVFAVFGLKPKKKKKKKNQNKNHCCAM